MFKTGGACNKQYHLKSQQKAERNELLQHKCRRVVFRICLVQIGGDHKAARAIGP